MRLRDTKMINITQMPAAGQGKDSGPCNSYSAAVHRAMLNETSQFQEGLERLAQPILPLVRLLHLLYLTGPFSSLAELLAELPEEIETATLTYKQPTKLLAPYLAELRELEDIKNPGPAKRIILNEAGQVIDGLESIEVWIAQQVLTRELEAINSLLCAPCDCAICCVGPAENMSQDFFEIPLQDDETGIFPLQLIDTEESRNKIADSEPPLLLAGLTFFKNSPAIYHWKNGWSLILPQKSSCPHLEADNLACRIYPERPEVCRRPQIFAYALEPSVDHNQPSHTEGLPVYVLRNKILAIWDCPYVKKFKDEIAHYAELCGLEPIFKENKN